MKIIIATRNEDKMVEVKQILADLPIELISLRDLIVNIEVSEDGQSFEDNALIKARQVCDATNEWVIGDDSGLCIQSLDGQAGVREARRAGSGADENQTVEHALQMTRAVDPDKRRAYFEGAVALVAPDGQEWVFTGRVNGRLADAARGAADTGMPYDRIFIPDGYDLTWAEMEPSLRHQLKHPAQAILKLKRFIIQAELLETQPELAEIKVIHSQEQPAE